MTIQMMQVPQSRLHSAVSWALSLTLHGLAVVCALAWVSGLKLAPQPTPFRWDVALQSPSQPSSRNFSPARPSAPQTPAPAMPAKQTVSPLPQSVQTVTPLPTPVVTHPPPVTTPAPLSRVAAPVISATSITTRASNVETPRPSVPSPEPQSVRDQPVPSPPARVSPIPPPASPAADSEPHVRAEAASTPAAPIQEASARPSPDVAPAAEKADYGWLANVLSSRIEHDKVYPPIARLNGWEGNVVVRVVIREDGELSGLAIAKSSGYEELDQAALETFRNASPLALPQPLGRSRLVLHVPMRFGLHQR